MEVEEANIIDELSRGVRSLFIEWHEVYKE